jgi:hypothetical protein
MAYNKVNYLKHVSRIVEIYNTIKEVDKKDTQIVKNEFPKHNIFISYRTWMNIKAMKPSTYKTQLSIFD